ncbi:histone-lysine N-methyltransferase SETMAR-like [Stegodyphus dumicola]|uniref:histone-lysine N-methyltransferase SETMAR-like n=1 Tax=Stegodyphus dumicola TaxID=202533 RepID=UPI0015B068DE|nr:histone-lysine N-methyltransferase SETMAR-like [Stegodyphus dumicola]
MAPFIFDDAGMATPLAFMFHHQLLKWSVKSTKISSFKTHLLFVFNRGANGAEAAREICEVYGEGAVPERTAKNWFAKFKNGNFDLENAACSGRPNEFDEERFNRFLHEDLRQTTLELAERMGCSQMTIIRYLGSMGKVQKL